MKQSRNRRQAFKVLADYHQFYLWDPGTNPEAPEVYDDEGVRWRVKTGPHVVIIQTARAMTVPAEVEIHDTDPGFDAGEWDHVAEASLHLPTGRLQVHECLGGPVAGFQVEPGWYRVRTLHGGLGTLGKTWVEGRDHYRAVLWPAPPSEVRVLRQWNESGS